MYVRAIVVGLVVGLGLACGGAGPEAPGSAEQAPESAEQAPGAASGTEAPGAEAPGSAGAAGAAEARASLLTFTAGAAVVGVSSEWSRLSSAAFAMDGSTSSYWKPDTSLLEPQWLVFELPVSARIERVALQNPSVTTPSQAFTVAVGPSASGPWTDVGAITPVEATRVGLTVSPPVEARYLRMSTPARASEDVEVLSLHEVYVEGELLSVPATVDVSGSWVGGWFMGAIRLQQRGVAVTGCLGNGGVLTGVVDGRTLQLQYPDPNGVPSRAEIVFVDAPDKPFLTQTLGDGEPGGQEYSLLEPTSTVDCAIAENGAKGVETALKTSLEESGRALVYDLLFDFNKATLRPASDEVLDRIAALLIAEPSWRIRIEGHTDDVGGTAYNQRLSEARAASTVTALVKRGVDAARLTSSGLGDTKPVQSNESAGGRAANRRVELVRVTP